MKKYYTIFAVALLLAVVGMASGVEAAVNYDFDRINVIGAATYMIRPDVGVNPNSWIVTKVAGDVSSSVTVLHGVVELGTVNSSNTVVEEFVKFSGKAGSVRFLGNSSRIRRCDSGDFNNIGTFFWSAKILSGNTVVKDLNPPVYSAALYRNYGLCVELPENSRASVMSGKVSFSNDGQSANAMFSSVETLSENPYSIDMSTYRHTGDETSSL